MSKKSPHPPYFAVKLLSLMKRYSDEYSTTGDLVEEYREIAKEKGRYFADFWYLGQVFCMIPTFILLYLEFGVTMFKNYLKVALRNIKRSKGISFINIAGLSVGMAVFLLILLYVQYELSFDKYHEKCDRIYRIVQKDADRPHYIETYGTNIIARTHAPLAMALVDEFPDVISAVRVIVDFQSNTLLSTNKKRFIENKICFADPSIFEIFSFKLIKGDFGSALNDPNSIILSERMEKKYFQNENPIGKIIRYNNAIDLIVTGVVENIPENSHFTMEFIIPFEKFNEINNIDATSWDHNWNCWTYCLFREDADISGFEKKLIPLAEKASNISGVRNDFLIQPLTSIHLYSHLFKEIVENSDIKYIYILLTIAFLVLVIACLNYINLTTACSSKRSREVGIRKIVGAHKRQLINQFFSESIIITIFALIISVIIFFLALPAFNSLVDRNLSLDMINNSQIVLLFSILLFSVSILAVSFPALFISSFKPIIVLKNAADKSIKGIKLRNILVTVQFSISIILIICTLVVKEQLSFINNKNIGYEKDRIVVLPLRDPGIRRNIQVTKTELLNNPAILKISLSNSLPNNIDSWQSIPTSVVKESGAMFRTQIDYDFLELYGIDLIEGRNFSRDFPSDEKSAVIINETAAKTLGIESPLGKDFEYHSSRKNKKIIGIVKDFNFRSLHNKIDPLYLELGRYSGYYLSVKIKGDQVAETIRIIKGQFEKISLNYPVEYYFFDETINIFYNSEQKVGTIVSIFALFAVSIASLGILGLSIFSTEQRKKEIAVRKTLGAELSSLYFLLTKEFLKWILVANIIAWPVGWYCMNKWLENFAYKISLDTHIFILSGLFALAIAIITIIIQVFKTATTNPVDSLRYE